MKKVLFVLCAYLGFYALALAQSSESKIIPPSVNNVIPPSPEVAALGKYVEMPIGGFN
jgi:hypothetical protein